ncbi:MAG TPA: asparagine--tRNA ligase [Ktedonobacterales bacterium]|nr:asparagine--tRNA ligase [Ktedonobacterales bacterium]
MRTNSISVREALAQPAGRQITVNGWVRTRRQSKAVSFVELNDGSSFKNLQVVLEQGTLPPETDAALTTGSCVRVTGDLVASPAAGQPVELRAREVFIYGTADPASFPLQKKGHSLEYLREIAHLRPRTNTFGAVFRVRNALAFAIHRFFQERGFLYIQAPVITASDAEGAGAMFGVTTLDLMNLPRTPDGTPDYTKDFFGSPAYLTVSGQLEAEIMALAFGQVYTFAPTFRAEDSNTPRHAAEFWMIEPEMAFYDLDDNRQLAEDFIKYQIKYVMEQCPDDLAFFNQRIEPGLLDALTHVLETPFAHVPYTEAVKLLEQSGERFQYPVHWGMDLQTEHERYLTEQTFKQPIVVTDYPKVIKAFYMRENDDGQTVRAMDVLVPRIGEIIGGSQREERYDVLLRRIREMKLKEENYWWYLELRKFGTAPHSGFGLGFERMMMFVTGMKNIRDVIAFPRTPGNAAF